MVDRLIEFYKNSPTLSNQTKKMLIEDLNNKYHKQEEKERIR